MIDLGVSPDTTLPLYDACHNVSISKKESFSYIFSDNLTYLRHLYNIQKLRPVTYDNIQKTILCGSVYLGWDYYECPSCHLETVIPHACHSRFCTKCGIKASQQRSAYVSSMALDSNHRHMVFTIPWELRDYLIKNRHLLDFLFVAFRNTLANVFNDSKFRKKKRKLKKQLFPKKNKSPYLFKDDCHHVTFGAVAALHTFGRNLQWNPHIHALVCEDAYDSKKDTIKNFSFISYQKLRHTWMYEVLNLLTPHLGDDFKSLKNDLYRIHEDGFYVYAPKLDEDMDEEDVEQCVSYITRYTSRPAMAQSRIINYHPTTKQIHWFYDDHKTKERVEVKEHVHTFLNNLILHCPEENFKMVRYYGFYSNKSKKLLNHVYELVGSKKRVPIKNWKERKKDIEEKLKKLTYRNHRITCFNKDPILCKCGKLMTYVESYNPFEGGGINDRRYRESCLRQINELRRTLNRGGKNSYIGT